MNEVIEDKNGANELNEEEYSIEEDTPPQSTEVDEDRESEEVSNDDNGKSKEFKKLKEPEVVDEGDNRKH